MAVPPLPMATLGALLATLWVSLRAGAPPAVPPRAPAAAAPASVFYVFVVVSHRRPDGDDAWLEAVLAGLSEVDAAWRVDAHASAGPAVYVFTKRRSACREVELVVHEYG